MREWNLGFDIRLLREDEFEGLGCWWNVAP